MRRSTPPRAAVPVVLCLALAFLPPAACGQDAGGHVIGVALPLSGDLAPAGREFLNGIALWVDEANAAGGVGGRPIRLEVRDDGNTPEGAARVARELAEREDVLGVIGHFYSSTAMGATGVYDEVGLVNVVPVANDPRVTGGSPWVFGMLPPTTAEGQFMAAWLETVLDVSEVAVIAETAAYGAGLADAFLEEAARREIEVVADRRFDPAEALPEGIVEALVSGEAMPSAVLVFSQVDVGRTILERLRAHDPEVPVVVPGAFTEDPSLPAFYRPFEGPLYAVSPFLYQTANAQATRFWDAYVERHGAVPGTGAPMAYDAARLLGTAIDAAGPDRRAIREFLAGLDGEGAIESVTGRLAFGESGAVARALYVTRVEDGHFKVAFTQLLPDEDGRLQPVDVAYVGIDQFRVETIDPISFSYDMELFLWVKWAGDGLDTSDIVVVNGIHGLDDERYVLVEDLSNPVRYRAYRIKSTFLTPFDLRDFPFDEQSLVLQVGHRTLDGSKLMLVPDVGFYRDEPVSLYDPEWDYLGQQVYSELYRYPSSFGNPAVGDAMDTPYFSSVNVNMTVARQSLPHVLTAVFPLILILSLTISVLWLSRVEFSTRLAIGMTALLAILVFHMTQSGSLPNVGYLTRIDLYFVLAYLWTFVLFLLLVAVYLLDHGKRRSAALWLNRLGPGAVLLAAAGSFAWVTWG